MISDNKKLKTVKSTLAKVRYIINPQNNDERVALIAFDEGTVIDITDADTRFNEIAREFTQELLDFTDAAVANKGGKRPAMLSQDIMTSFTKDDFEGGKINAKKAVEIVREQIKMVMGPGKRKIIFSVHMDTDEIHVHAVASIVDENGKVFSRSQLAPNERNDFRAWERSNEILEIKYDLERVQNRKSENRLKEDKSPTNGEYWMQSKGIESNKKYMKDAIKEAKANCNGDFNAFVNELAQKDIFASFKTHPEKGIVGVTFSYNKFITTGSKLGKQFSGNALQKAVGFDFNNKNHAAIVDRSNSVFEKFRKVIDTNRAISKAQKHVKKAKSPKTTKSAVERHADKTTTKTSQAGAGVVASKAITSDDPQVRAQALADWMEQIEAADRAKLDEAIAEMEAKTEAIKADAASLLQVFFEMLSTPVPTMKPTINVDPITPAQQMRTTSKEALDNYEKVLKAREKDRITEDHYGRFDTGAPIEFSEETEKMLGNKDYVEAKYPIIAANIKSTLGDEAFNKIVGTLIENRIKVTALERANGSNKKSFKDILYSNEYATNRAKYIELMKKVNELATHKKSVDKKDLEAAHDGLLPTLGIKNKGTTDE